MKKPSKQAVIEAIRKDWPEGKVRYLESVVLDSGVMIVEYEIRTPVGFPSGTDKVHVTQRVVVKTLGERVYSSIITKSWFEVEES